MITWCYGESGSGKTTLANQLPGIKLDGDAIRNGMNKDLGFTMEDRLENNRRIACIADLLNRQGYDVVVSTICPTQEMRQQVYWICKCRFVKVEGERKCECAK